MGCLVGSACACWCVEEMGRCRLEEEVEGGFREKLRGSCSRTEADPQEVGDVLRRGDLQIDCSKANTYLERKMRQG